MMLKLLLFLALAPASGFVRPPHHPHTRRRAAAAKVAPRMFGAADAFASFTASQAETLAKIRAGVPDLAEKPDFTWAAGGGHAVGGAPATLLAFDAPGASNVAWLSALDVEGTMSSLTVYNGPLTDVPHLASRVALTSSGDFLSIFLDWRPRAYGAYEV